jgi:hypothetical protein
MMSKCNTWSNIASRQVCLGVIWFDHLKHLIKENPMKKILYGLTVTLLLNTSLCAVKLSEFLNTKPIGQQVSKAEPSPLVPDNVVGKFFTLESDPKKKWQVRFFTFEDRNGTLKDQKEFASFVKEYGLGDLESQNDSMPYKDDTLHSFTYKQANKLLKANGKKQLPKNLYFVISFREVSEQVKK